MRTSYDSAIKSDLHRSIGRHDVVDAAEIV